MQRLICCMIEQEECVRGRTRARGEDRDRYGHRGHLESPNLCGDARRGAELRRRIILCWRRFGRGKKGEAREEF
jgi:hypothetical protein